MTISEEALSFMEYAAFFEACGGTDLKYLEHHFPRYVQTKKRFLVRWPRERGVRILDVGAHWLHQALMYARDGFQVTALDMPITFEMENVRKLARTHEIELLANADLEHIPALASLADDTFDVVLFTEIIEHITFNPVAMWREIYRVMKPGGRIVVTTPNYYALRGRAWKLPRFVRGFGGGIDPLGILEKKTYTHHWKEYSMRELIYYFCVLSPDFNCIHPAYPEEYQPNYLGRPAGKLVRAIEHWVPRLRPDLYLEVELTRKDKGIVVEPHW